MEREEQTDAPIIDPRHQRAGLRLVQRAIYNGWKIPDQIMEQMPKVVVQMVLNAKNDREKLRAIEVLVAMQRDNLAALQAADKIERLESGGATERIELGPISLRMNGNGS